VITISFIMIPEVMNSRDSPSKLRSRDSPSKLHTRDSPSKLRSRDTPKSSNPVTVTQLTRSRTQPANSSTQPTTNTNPLARDSLTSASQEQLRKNLASLSTSDSGLTRAQKELLATFHFVNNAAHRTFGASNLSLLINDMGLKFMFR
jgi:hypothetical protein